VLRQLLLIPIFVCAVAGSVAAQTHIYVSGDLFAEMPKFSRLTTSPDLFGTSDTVTPQNGVGAGGGGRIGVFLSPEWSVEFGVDIAGTISSSRTTLITGPIGIVPPPTPVPYTSNSTNSYGATSVLLGYHPPVHGRVHPGLLGGISFMHRVASYDSPTVSTASSAAGTTMTVTSTTYGAIDNGLTATVGAEAAVDVSDQLAIVPEVRVHAGGIGAILIRPGVAVRWRW
jgi:hypothetical protein